MPLVPATISIKYTTNPSPHDQLPFSQRFNSPPIHKSNSTGYHHYNKQTTLHQAHNHHMSSQLQPNDISCMNPFGHKGFNHNAGGINILTIDQSTRKRRCNAAEAMVMLMEDLTGKHHNENHVIHITTWDDDDFSAEPTTLRHIRKHRDIVS